MDILITEQPNRYPENGFDELKQQKCLYDLRELLKISNQLKREMGLELSLALYGVCICNIHELTIK